MRKVILQEFVSLDGLAAGPDNSVAFVPAATGAASHSRRRSSATSSSTSIASSSVPNVLGSGRPLFRENGALDMKLLNATSYDRGAVQLLYTQEGSQTKAPADTRHARATG